jgi:hypothetical protein
MTPLRNAQPKWWETAFTFEFANNIVNDFATEQDLFVPPYGDNVEKLLRLVNLAHRQIEAVWTGKQVSRSDEKLLLSIAATCRLGLGIDGAPLVRTEHLDDLSGLGQTEMEALGYDGLIWAMEDGICEWILRGRTPDVRACLWHGGLFRADRANAVFDRASCRTAYHRALNTAASSSKEPEALLGFFRCVECQRELLIDAASGLRRYGSGVFIGHVLSRELICSSCAEQNHPEWADYIVPMSSAA